jgi:quercetin dioxygenase-like cupin family protein
MAGEAGKMGARVKSGKKRAKGKGPAPDSEGKTLEVLARSSNMEGILVTVEPGSDWGLVYSHPGEEIRYILEGQLEVDIGGKKAVLEKGDCLWHSAQVPHSLRNPGKKKAKYFVVIIPPSFS